MTPLSPRKLAIVKAVCDYHTLTRAVIQRIVGVGSDRVMRAMLDELKRENFIQKTRMLAVSSGNGNTAPVYFPSRKGAELIAAETGLEHYLRISTRTPDWTHLYHWLAVAEFHVTLDQAVERLPSVSLLGWYGEWDEVNPQASAPKDRYRIYTLIREKPKLVCAPDACFALGIGQFSKSYYLEFDRGTTGIQQIAASKSPGYAALLTGRLHERHFVTTAESFTVLHVSPTTGRRDLLRKAMASKESAFLHRFATIGDWTPEAALTEPIFYAVGDDAPQPLIRLPKGGES